MRSPALHGCLLVVALSSAAPASAAPWPGFARDPQHSALSPVASQPLARIRWSTPVDLLPQYTGAFLYAHYGSPVITALNTVVLPVKVGATGGFRIEARSGADGSLLWSAPSDYVLPPHNWVPSFNATLTAANRVVAPGSGGKILYRDNADSPVGAAQSHVFYGAGAYAAAPAAYDATVFINTPLTADAQGNVYFGFAVTGANPSNLASGIARVAPDGTATWIDAAAMMGSAQARVPMNSAPALSLDQSTLYVALRTVVGLGAQVNLLALDSATLALKSSVPLFDPATGANVVATDDSTASPTVGPDGDVYYGVLGAAGSGHASKGWMMHFDATLATVKTPGAFGWDNTPSIVPVSMVPSYAGPSSYLLMTKYNSYIDGQHRIAILDPNQAQGDFGSSVSVMREILTILGPTPDPGGPGRVMEWCINTAAVDPVTRSVLANSEDGFLYRWDLTTNQFPERIALNSGVGQAYTATAIGPDGAVYAVNNAVLASVGRLAQPLSLTGVVSRKAHAGAGSFDLPVDTTKAISGAVTVESRAIGPGHTFVFQFDGAITSPGTLTVVDEAAAPVAGATAVFSGNEVTVTIPALADNKRVTVSLAGVNGAGLNASVSLGFLVGDVNGSGSVTASDILQVKGRAGQMVTAGNFAFDLNASGAITATDILAVKGRSGTILP